MLLRLAFQFLRCIKKCSGKFAQTTARNRISSRSKNIFALALKTFGKNPSGGGVGNEGERLRVWDYPNKQNAGAFYGKGTPFLCLLRNFLPLSLLHGKFDFAKAGQKKNVANCDVSNCFLYEETRELYSPVVSLLASSIPFAVADRIFKSFSLMPSSMVSS